MAHNDETRKAISEGLRKHHAEKRRLQVVRTGEGRVRTPPPSRERLDPRPQREE